MFESRSSWSEAGVDKVQPAGQMRPIFKNEYQEIRDKFKVHLFFRDHYILGTNNIS